MKQHKKLQAATLSRRQFLHGSSMLLSVLPFSRVLASPWSTQGQGQGEFLDLDKDPFVTGGLTPAIISNGLLPVFGEKAPKVKSDEVVVFAFNYDIPKLQLAFRDSKGKVHTRTGKLAKGEKLVATINSRKQVGGSWKVNATVRWAQHCGNPLPLPFEVNLEIPQWGEEPVITRAEIPKPAAVTVREQVVIQQLVPTFNDVEIVVPPAERGRYRLVEVGREEAGRRWEYQKNFWDHLLDFLKVVALPLAAILRKADRINVSAIGGFAFSESSAAASAAASASASAASASG